MKLVEKTFTRGGCYSFLIALALLIISHALGVDEFGNYAIILNVRLYLVCAAAGFAIALVGLIFETKIDPIFKRLIHFIVLLCGFVAIFATSQTGSPDIAKKLLMGIFLFAVAYVVIFLLLMVAKKIIALIEKKYSGRQKLADDTQEQYVPLYKK